MTPSMTRDLVTSGFDLPNLVRMTAAQIGNDVKGDLGAGLIEDFKKIAQASLEVSFAPSSSEVTLTIAEESHG